MQSPADALQQIQQQIAAARSAGASLRICGGGSKTFYAASSESESVQTQALCGIVDYEPSELVVTAYAGTPLIELEALLAQHGQCLPFEPPHFAWAQPSMQSMPTAQATVGGMVACGLSGPARASVGGVRDYVLGLHTINGLGEYLRFGGQVMKNVAGFDVSRLMVGALGTLGLITQVSLKVLPIPPAEATLCFALDQTSALEQLHRWGAQALPLNASYWFTKPSEKVERGEYGEQDQQDQQERSAEPLLFVRLRGASAAVEAACRQMLCDASGVRVAQPQAHQDWADCRNQTHAFFARPSPTLALWRISVPQTAPALPLPWPQLVEWHGALRWLWAAPHAGADIRAAAHAGGGSAAIFVEPSAAVDAALAAEAANLLPSHQRRLDSASAAQASIAKRLKASFDPDGLWNRSLGPAL